jgi:hypothetical protein
VVDSIGRNLLAWLTYSPYSTSVSCPDSYNSQHDRDGAASSDAGQRFALAIEQWHRESGSTTSNVRDAACAYVLELKAKSLPPERVLVEIKRMLALVPGLSMEDEDAHRHLLQQVITWCIEAYYRTD